MEQVYGYVRVSTETQAKSGYGAEAQQNAIIDYCKNNKLELIDIFYDMGVTGTTIERDGLTDLITNINGVKKVVVLNTSRLWRNDTVRVLIKHQLEKISADVISIEQPNYSLYADNPNDYLINGMMELLDQYERMNTILKLARGRRAKAKSGVKGSGETPLGYKWKHDGVNRPIVIIDQEQAALVKLIFESYLELGSISKVKSFLDTTGYLTKRGKQFSTMAIRNILVNEFYTGKITWGSIQAEGKHKAIIDKNTFAHVQEKIRFNTRNPGNKSESLYE